MSTDSHPDPTFHITHEPETGDHLLVGLSQFGLAGLTAVDYLVDRLDLDETGHLTAEGLPSITPFEDGQPRHHTRLFSGANLEASVLVGELFVPVGAANPFSHAVLEWTEANEVDEITILAGVPLSHGPSDHGTFYVATDDYHERRIEGTEIPAMGRGFLDGVNARLVERGLNTDLAVGAFVTPVHAQVPDVDAALRLLSTVRTIYDVDVDTAPLETFADEVRQHYAQLSERLEAAADHEVPEDRMYM